MHVNACKTLWTPLTWFLRAPSQSRRTSSGRSELLISHVWMELMNPFRFHQRLLRRPSTMRHCFSDPFNLIGH